MSDYHYTHWLLWLIASIPLLTAVILWIRICREEDEDRRLRRRYEARLLEYVARCDDPPLTTRAKRQAIGRVIPVDFHGIKEVKGE